jgi:type IV fimbrial biogenesis protein FimT
LLEPVMRAYSLRPTAGFTLIELVATIAIAAILATLVIPSFTGFFSKRRVEGVATELATDLQYARSEAVARNRNVLVTFGNTCYVVYMSPATASTPSTCTVSDPAAVVKSVSVQGVSMTRLSSVETITFEPVLGSASNNVGADPAVAEVTAPSGRLWKLQVRLSSQGRVKTCSPAGDGFVFGYNSDCGAS